MYVEGNYVFGVLKQNLKVDRRIIMGRTTAPELDGKCGTIMGVTFDNVCDIYIIALDEPINGQKAICLTEACICPLEELL